VTERCMMYVDGYNFYYAIKRHPDVTPLYYGWCDFRRLAQEHLLGPDQHVVGIRYFTAPVGRYGAAGGPGGSEAARQGVWLAALGTIQGLEVIEGVHTGDVASPRSRKEKETDVNIAVTAVVDAARDKFDRAILLTGDRDQRPTVTALSREFGKGVDIWLAPSQQLGFWTAMAALPRVTANKMSPKMLLRSRLPDSLIVDGKALQTPREWRAPQ
jgi:uncharacterized LabA/DUF88 family protein